MSAGAVIYTADIGTWFVASAHDSVMSRSLAWRRLLLPSVLFGLGIAAAVWDWHRHPPVTGADGRLLNMRNGPGDLAGVLELYIGEFLLMSICLQPWRAHPRLGPIAIGALIFGVWGILRWLIGLHSPTVMLAHDVLMLIVAVALGMSCLVFSLPPSPGDAR